jgi:hypothetical protein
MEDLQNQFPLEPDAEADRGRQNDQADAQAPEPTPEQNALIDERLDQGFNYVQAAQMAGVKLPDVR